MPDWDRIEKIDEMEIESEYHNPEEEIIRDYYDDKILYGWK